MREAHPQPQSNQAKLIRVLKKKKPPEKDFRNEQKKSRKFDDGGPIGGGDTRREQKPSTECRVSWRIKELIKEMTRGGLTVGKYLSHF